MRLGVAAGNRTRDLLHCRRTLYAKSHSNGVTKHYLGTSFVLLHPKDFCEMALGPGLASLSLHILESPPLKRHM